jgi:hypothetical protein
MARGEINPVTGITDGVMRSQLKSDLRSRWRNSSRKVFINSVRERRLNPKNGRVVFQVQCQDCKVWMPTAEKARRVKKDGGLEKKAKSLHDVNHIHGVTPLDDIQKNLGNHWYDLFYGEVEILCVSCHKIETSKQATQRSSNK